MNARFALSLPKADAPTLGAVSLGAVTHSTALLGTGLLGTMRRWQGLEVCEADGSVWLRAEHLDDEQWDYCRRLPGADRFTLTLDGRLLSVGKLVPHGRLPAGPWRPIGVWLEVELPPRGFALPPPQPTGLALVRSTTERDAAWLLTEINAWCAYAATAPQVRLANWSFAADAAGRVLIRGTPLPPLPGTQFVVSEGIAVPVGFAWSPAVGAAVLRRVFRLERDDGVLWTADGVRRRIAAGDWVRATRSAVRLTRDRLLQGLLEYGPLEYGRPAEGAPP